VTSGSTAIICFMIATVALINGVIYIEEWYGFFCMLLGVAFAVTGALLWREAA